LQLDSYTLLVASCGLMILLGSAFVFVWLRDRRSTWLLWWGGPIIFTGAALTFYLQSNWSDNFVAIAFGNAARIGAVGCLWYGIRLFEGRRPPWGAVTAISAAWVALCFYPPFVENLTARIVVVSLIMCALCALAANELWSERDDGLRSRFPTMLVFASAAILMFVRALVAGIAPFPVGASTLDPIWLAVFSYLAVGHVVFAAIFFLAMTMERREAEQRSFALSDPLTGLLNRRAFTDFAQRMARRRAGLRDPMGLLVLDLDHFKQVNDQHGHDVGDRMLRAFAEASEDSVRPTDQLFRMGGEEFCFVLPATTLEEAIDVAERIRRAFEAVAVATTGGSAATSVSIGIAATSFAIDIEVLLAAADAAMYEAKSRGRNRVVVAEPSTLMRGDTGAIPFRRRA
jgi:diguanylate cyclase (GGDEF)-like protein